MKNQLKEELKTLLVGKEFKEDDYNETLLNNMLKDFNVEVNLCDFDFDRVYKAGYEAKEDWDTEYIASKINESNYTAGDADKKLDFLIKKIEEKEKNKLFLKAELAKEENIPEKPVRPKKAQNIAIAAVLGLFLSCGYVTARFLIKKQ